MVEDVRSPGAPPPRGERPGATVDRIRNRRCGAVAVLLVFAVIAVGARWSFASHRGTSPTLPFPATTLRGRTGTGELWVGGAPAPLLLVYVDSRCPLCKAELGAWSRETFDRPDYPIPTVVLSPSTVPPNLSFLPEVFRERWIHDRDTVIGRALGLRGVPTTAAIVGGQVVTIEPGLSSPSARARLVQLVTPLGGGRTAS